MDLLVLPSHPIQYQACVWRALHGLGTLEIEVWYGSNYGVVAQASRWGMSDFRWDLDLTSGYPHRFLGNWSPSANPQTYFGKLYPPLVSEIARAKPKAILVQGYRNLHEHLALLSGALIGSRIIFRSDNNELTSRGWLKQRLRDPVLRALYRRVDAFLTIGQANERHYRDHGVPTERLFRAPYGVDEEHFSRVGAALRTQAASLKAELGVPSTAPLVAAASVLTPVKALDTLIDAIAAMPGVHLAVAGSGPLEHALRQQAERIASGRVHFLGFLNQTALPRLYAAADIFCLPSRFEPWGLVVNEAIAVGTPVVVSNVCGVAQDVVTAGAGLSCPPDNPTQLRRALDSALADPHRFTAGLDRFTASHRCELTAHAIAEAIAPGHTTKAVG